MRELRPNPGDGLKAGGAGSASSTGSSRKVLRLRTDGAARGNPGPAGAGILIEDDQGMRLQALHHWLGRKTNNEAEYQALIEGLKAVRKWKPDRLEVLLDSKLVVEQVNGRYKVKAPELAPLHKQATELLAEFPEYRVEHVDREKNRGADHLANMAIEAHVPKTKFGG